MDDRHADATEVLRIADAGKLQDVRRADRAGREDHLTSRVGPLHRATWAAARELDADRALPVEQNAMHERLRDQQEVRPLQRRPQIGACGAGPAAATARLLAPADTFACAGYDAVDVFAVFEPEFLAGLNHAGADRRAVGPRGEQWPVLTAHLGFLALPAFRLAEIGQAVVPRPASVAELAPMIVILGLAADIDE